MNQVLFSLTHTRTSHAREKIKGNRIKELAKTFVLLLPLTWQVRINFKVRVGYWPSLKSPKSFNEKIQYRKLFVSNPLFVICSDKFAVRDYVKEKIGEEYLIPLLYVGTTINELQLQSFNDDFVVKTTHDSGGVSLVQKNGDNDYKAIMRKLEESVNYDFGRAVSEPWYSLIQPKVIVEKMLVTNEGNIPDDFKFHVFRNESAEVRVILEINYDRFESHNITYYDQDLNILPFSIQIPNNRREIKRIKNYEKMVELAVKLAEDFNYARVDLYNVDGTIYFGEITFASGSGFDRFSDKKHDDLLGSYWG